ncbi:MAG: hypothetical protein EOP86_11700 [Verrucomicrobiaceae bacterium]|nr:MAG: hypothetical protein EOP86_11700 [Verrucomicrobiaceae bacterium]
MTSTRAHLRLPECAGLGGLERMASPGISVEGCVDRLKGYHYTLLRCWRILVSRLTAEPVYELKMAWSLHAHLCAEHVTALRERVAEMRHPPLGLDKVPSEALKLFFDEIQAAPTPTDLIHGIHQVALPALRDAMRRHLADTNPLADAPTCRILKFALQEIGEMIQWGREALASDLPAACPAQGGEAWEQLLADCLATAGTMGGSGPANPRPLVPRFSAQGWQYDRTPRRDARFPDPYNMGVHAEAFLYNPDFPARAKTLMMYYKRLREIDVPEMMASILTEIEDKPWGFYRDLTRQLWDEARHAMMGEAGFTALGIDWPAFVMVNFTWSKGLNEQLTPRERHAVLWFIEQGLMNKTGKRYEWEVGTESGDPLSRLFQDYDWADEVLHARIGRDWYVKDFDNDPHKAAAYGSACWSKVVSDWEKFRTDGLTQHRNWWPELYEEFCRLRGEAPDPAALAFRTTYADTRADLERIAASG